MAYKVDDCTCSDGDGTMQAVYAGRKAMNQRTDCSLQHLAELLMPAHALHHHSLTRCQEQRRRSAVAYKIADVGARATASFLLLERPPAAAI
jgi:hypothetical protein